MEESKTVKNEVVGPSMKIKKITVRDLPRITRYLNETELKDKIQVIMFPQEEMKVTSWAEFREELNLELDELTEIQENTSGDLLMALKTTPGAQHLAPKKMDGQEMGNLVFNTIYDVIDNEDIFNKTVDILAYLYQVDIDVVQDLGIGELKEAVSGVLADQNFL